ASQSNAQARPRGRSTLTAPERVLLQATIRPPTPSPTRHAAPRPTAWDPARRSDSRLPREPTPPAGRVDAEELRQHTGRVVGEVFALGRLEAADLGRPALERRHDLVGVAPAGGIAVCHYSDLGAG